MLVAQSIRDLADSRPAHVALAGVMGHQGLARDIAAGIRASLLAAGNSSPTDRDIVTTFANTVDAVALDVDGHETGRQMLALLTSDWDVPDAHAGRCIEYVYSQLVNKFKGELAEYLAVRPLLALAEERRRSLSIPTGAALWRGCEVPGFKRDGRAPRPQWEKGPDAVFVTEEREGHRAVLTVHAVVEVKGYRPSPRYIAKQLSSHVRRLAEGLRVGARMWTAENVKLTTHLARILAVPAPSSDRARTASLAAVVSDLTLLPYTAPFLSAAAYEITVWFMRRLGARAFAQAEHRPWPGMSAETAGENAIKQALYYLLMRDLSPRAQRIATRLYNVYGYGFDAATDHRGMIWIVRGEPTSEITDSAAAELKKADVAALVDEAWSSYRRCRMADAVATIQLALGSNPDARTEKRLRNLRAMIYFFDAQFEEAARAMSEPDAEPRGLWARGRLQHARALARSGCSADASQIADEVRAQNLLWRSIPVLLALTESIIALVDGREDTALARACDAWNAIVARAREIDARRAAGLGINEPYAISESDVASVAAELVTVFLRLGDVTLAFQALEHTRGVFAPYLRLLTHDPFAAPLRDHPASREKFLDWLTAECGRAGVQIADISK